MNGHVYFWDPKDCTNAHDFEYGVYVLYRDWGIARLADTFRDFITDICLNKGIPAYENRTLIEPSFVPGE
jgi:hypothetical protein